MVEPKEGWPEALPEVPKKAFVSLGAVMQTFPLVQHILTQGQAA
jgi:hypothetical protein